MTHRVLIVEDDPLIAMDLEAIAVEAGADATCCVSVPEALERLDVGRVRARSARHRRRRRQDVRNRATAQVAPRALRVRLGRAAGATFQPTSPMRLWSPSLIAPPSCASASAPVSSAVVRGRRQRKAPNRDGEPPEGRHSPRRDQADAARRRRTPCLAPLSDIPRGFRGRPPGRLFGAPRALHGAPSPHVRPSPPRDEVRRHVRRHRRAHPERRRGTSSARSTPATRSPSSSRPCRARPTSSSAGSTRPRRSTTRANTTPSSPRASRSPPACWPSC